MQPAKCRRTGWCASLAAVMMCVPDSKLEVILSLERTGLSAVGDESACPLAASATYSPLACLLSQSPRRSSRSQWRDLHPAQHHSLSIFSLCLFSRFDRVRLRLSEPAKQEQMNRHQGVGSPSAQGALIVSTVRLLCRRTAAPMQSLLGLLLLLGEQTKQDEIFAGQLALCRPPWGGAARFLLSLRRLCWPHSMVSLSAYKEKLLCTGAGSLSHYSLADFGSRDPPESEPRCSTPQNGQSPYWGAGICLCLCTSAQ